mgnify:FL=1
MTSLLETAQALNKILEPDAPLLTSVSMFSTETRAVLFFIHNSASMRAAVTGDNPKLAAKGVEKLESFAIKNGGKFARVYDAVKGKRRLSASVDDVYLVVKALRAAAAAWESTDDE